MRILWRQLLFFLIVSTVKSVSVERQQKQLLDALNLSNRPPFFRRPPPIPPFLAHRKEDLVGGTLEKIVVEATHKSWTCVTPETLVADCFSFSFDAISLEVLAASIVVSTRSELAHESPDLSIRLLDVDETFGTARFIDRFELSERETLEGGHAWQLSFDVSQHLQSWIRRRERSKMIKVEILSGSMSPLNEKITEIPYFEVSVFRPHWEIESKNECSGCCVVPFYVNFTEIGWSDWILSPPGFWANYCAGPCSGDTDETYQFMRSVLPDHSMLPEPTCAPNYYGSVDFIVALSARDIRKTRVHGMRALSCSCT